MTLDRATLLRIILEQQVSLAPLPRGGRADPLACLPVGESRLGVPPVIRVVMTLAAVLFAATFGAGWVAWRVTGTPSAGRR